MRKVITVNGIKLGSRVIVIDDPSSAQLEGKLGTVKSIDEYDTVWVLIDGDPDAWPFGSEELGLADA